MTKIIDLHARQLKAVDVVLNAVSYDEQREALTYWRFFIPHDMPRMRLTQTEVEYVDEQFTVLRLYVSEWYANYRFKDLYARLEALEEFTGLTDRS